MIELVTFTGVDSTTSFHGIKRLAKKYPNAEFGVLVGTHSGKTDYGIFPPLSTVRNLNVFGALVGINTAIHLCGEYARQVMDPDGPSADLLQLCKGFGRVQVNLHGDSWSPFRVEVSVKMIKAFADKMPGEVILQHRGPWADVPVIYRNITYLFDRSEGGGVEGIEDWPPPPNLATVVRLGYAGGLGPHNIDLALAVAANWPEACKLWFDMEGNIRTKGLFDLDKVEQVAAAVWPTSG